MKNLEANLHGVTLANGRELAKRAIDWTREMLRCIDRGRATGLAAETAFWLFLSLLPLAAVAGLVAAHLSLANWADVAPLIGSMPPDTRRFVREELVNVAAWNEGTVGLTSSAVFVWLASSGVHSIFDSLELEMGLNRPWWKKRALAIVSCIGLSVAVAFVALLGPGIEAAAAWLGNLVPFASHLVAAPLARLVRFVMSFLVVFGYTVVLYRVGIPRDHGEDMPIVPGALVASILQILFGLGYSVYIAAAGTGSTYMASLAVVAITMTGVYLFSFALLIGGVLNHKLATDRCPAVPPDPAEPRASVLTQ